MIGFKYADHLREKVVKERKLVDFVNNIIVATLEKYNNDDLI